MMSHLYSKCGSLRKEMLQIAGGTHNDTWTGNGYELLSQYFIQMNNLNFYFIV